MVLHWCPWFLCLHCNSVLFFLSLWMDDRHVCIRFHFSTKNSFTNWCRYEEREEKEGRCGERERGAETERQRVLQKETERRKREKRKKAVKMECKYWKQLHDTRLGLLKWLQATLFARLPWSSLVIIYDATTFVSPTEFKEWHTQMHTYTHTPNPNAFTVCTNTYTQTDRYILWTHAARKREWKVM